MLASAGRMIEKCLRSIQKSKHTELEILVVNDGSTDDTVAIVEKLAALDYRIRLINQENGGVSSARNHGIDEARGEYISFIDADDYVAEEYFSVLLEACHDGVDVACCLPLRVDTEGNPLFDNIPTLEKDLIVTPQEIADNYFRYLEMGCINFVFRLFRREIVGDARFCTNLKWGEDGSFNLEIFKRMAKMYISKERMYSYVIYPGQTTAKRMPRYGDMMIVHIGDIDRYLNFYGTYERQDIRYGMGRVWLGIYCEAARHAKSYSEYKKTFFQFKEQPWDQYISLPFEVDIRWRLMKWFVVKKHPQLAYFFVRSYTWISSARRKVFGH